MKQWGYMITQAGSQADGRNYRSRYFYIVMLTKPCCIYCVLIQTLASSAEVYYDLPELRKGPEPVGIVLFQLRTSCRTKKPFGG